MATRVRGSAGSGMRRAAADGSRQEQRNSYTRSTQYTNRERRYTSAAGSGRTGILSNKELNKKTVKRQERGYDDVNSVKKKSVGEIIKSAIFKPAAGEIDYAFLTAVIAILAFGLVMLLSASAPRAKALNEKSTAYYFFIRQLGFSMVGLAGMFVVSKMDYRDYRRFAWPLAWIGVTLLILVLLIGTSRNGAKRWLFGIQPSEFIKPIVAMLMAHIITEKKFSMRHLREFAIPVAYMALVCFLMIKEPHVSGVVIIVGITLCIMVVAGMPVLRVVLTGVVLVFAVVLGVKMFSPIRWARITSFLNPFADQQGSSYQITQSIYAIGSGGITGRGLGQSLQKFQFLPEPYNDFIFSVVCEELGLIGAIVVMGLFAFLIIRGIKIAMNAPDRYSMLFATGIVAHVAIQSVLNMGVASSAIPNTGISLPFFSYGGTSIVTLLCEMGVLLNISRYKKR